MISQLSHLVIFSDQPKESFTHLVNMQMVCPLLDEAIQFQELRSFIDPLGFAIQQESRLGVLDLLQRLNVPCPDVCSLSDPCRTVRKQALDILTYIVKRSDLPDWGDAQFVDGELGRLGLLGSVNNYNTLRIYSRTNLY